MICLMIVGCISDGIFQFYIKLVVCIIFQKIKDEISVVYAEIESIDNAHNAHNAAEQPEK